MSYTLPNQVGTCLEVSPDVKTILLWISGISLLVGATFTMALFRGDRIRGVYSSEEMSNRPLRLKIGGACLLLGIICGSVASAIE